jgi:predicted acylesterase/phospholipase RssA
MSKRLALVVRGAVSLGSYEAGVLYELLRAIERHNHATVDPEQRVEIDVLVGASAGAMTAAIGAHVLAGGTERMRGPHDNPFYAVWVKAVDLANLLRLRPADNPAAALLSGEYISELAEREVGKPPIGIRHTAAPDNRPIRLAFALSNLRGLDYDTVTSGVAFPFTRFQDEWRGEVDPKRPAAADWRAIHTAAVASGSFPAAFPVRGVTRWRDEYNVRFLSGADWPAQEATRILPYTDGGVFNNEPLGLAKELVDCADDHLDNDNRVYLYISPSPKHSEVKTDFPVEGVPVLSAVRRLITAVIGQAQYQDLSALAKTNRRIDALNATAAALARELAAEPALEATLAQAAPALGRLAFAGAERGEETLTDARLRLIKQYRTQAWFEPSLTSDQRMGIWAALLAAFERSAGLQHKDEMVMLAICAEECELLGDPLAHFGGFTCEAVRHHDYEVGRAKAQAWLNPPAGEQPNRLGLTKHAGPFEPVDLAGAHQAATIRLAADADAIGERVGDRVGEHLEGMMQRAELWWGWRKPARWVMAKLTARLVEHALKKEAESPPPGQGRAVPAGLAGAGARVVPG